MAGTATATLRLERNIILVSLLALAAGAWALLAWRSTVMDQEMSLTMGLSPVIFIALWIAMMVAIMFPTAAPMILMFSKIHASRRQDERAFVPTWVFVGAYILLWSAIGLAAYAIALAGDGVADQSRWVMENAERIGGGLLMAGGLYQLTPLKTICLSKCRTPMSFILNSWRDGYGGSFMMGLEHGAYCLGCCWLLFLILFPLGMMNIAVLSLIALLIFVEKSMPVGRQASVLAALALVVYGLVVVFVPEALPMSIDHGAM